MRRSVLKAGSPRALMFLSSEDQRVGKIHSLAGCKLSFALFTHRRLRACVHLFKEDELVGALDPVPGLRSARIELGDGEGDSKIDQRLPCLTARSAQGRVQTEKLGTPVASPEG